MEFCTDVDCVPGRESMLAMAFEFATAVEFEPEFVLEELVPPVSIEVSP
jgi:hypothetical protein